MGEDNTAVVLSEEEQGMLEQKKLWALQNSVRAEQLALDAARLLSCTETRLDKLKNQGFFTRCCKAFSGANTSLDRANVADLAQMQKIALAYITMLQEQQIMTAHSLLTLKNNLVVLASEHEETRQMVLTLAEKTLHRFQELENRVGELTVSQNLQGWLLTLEDRDYDERFPGGCFRMLRIIGDYYGYKQDDWNYNDMLFLRKALRLVHIDPKKRISMKEFIDRLADEISEYGLDAYRELLFRQTGRAPDAAAFALEHISSPVFIVLNRIYEQYTDKYDVVELLSDSLSISTEEALRKILRDSVSRLGVDMDYQIPLSDIASEILVCLRLERKLREMSALNAPEEDAEEMRQEPEKEQGPEKERPEPSEEKEETVTEEEPGKDREEGGNHAGDKTDPAKEAISILHSMLGMEAMTGDTRNYYVRGYSELTPGLRKKIRAGIESFGRGIAFDDVIAYYDSTLFGGGDEGFILCDDRILYKSSFSDPDFEMYSWMGGIEKKWSGFVLDMGLRKVDISCTSSKVRDEVFSALNLIIITYDISRA